MRSCNDWDRHMSDCPHCVAAQEGPTTRSNFFCSGCVARLLGRSKHFAAAKKARPEDHDFDRVRQLYRDELVRLGVTHQQVLEARKVDFESRSVTA